MLFRRILLPLLIVSSACFASVASAQPVDAGRAKVELVAERTMAVPGETVWLGLSFELDKGWHIYWKNPGDAGIPPTISWADSTDQDALQIGEFSWPAPELLPVVPGEIMDYGYSGKVVLPFPVQIPEDAGAPILFEGRTDYLICETICIPESADIRLNLATGDTQVPDAYGARLITEALAETPIAFSGETALTEQEGAWTLSLKGAEVSGLREEVRFFPAGFEIVHAADQAVSYGADGLQISLMPDQADLPNTLSGTIVAGDLAVDVSAEPGPVLPGTSGISVSVPDSAPVNLFLLIILALIGGLILNLMPCVLPVLSIKALGIVSASAEGNVSDIRKHGLWYLAGVLTCFAGLAIAIISVRAATGLSTWGFWLQSPTVVTVLILLIFLIGLWLLGLFELGGSVQNIGSGLAARQGPAGAYFTGLLAAIVGAPCTGPFLGAALGAIMSQPAIEVFIVLLAMGFGMALPFVLISFLPGLHKHLPKPGPWMETLKQVFAFPMFLTAAWLLSVLGALAGYRAAAILVACAALIGFGIWAMKTANQGGRATLIASAALASILPLFALMGVFSSTEVSMLALAQALLGLGGLFGAIYLFTRLSAERTGQLARLLGVIAVAAGLSVPIMGASSGPATASASVSQASYTVEPWSKARVAALQEEGRPIFIDFTAEWCATCQANKLQVLRTKAVSKAFLDANVAFLEADFTRPDPEIAAELRRHDRAGVPLYLWYDPAVSDPTVLPEVLSVKLVTDLVSDLP